MPAKVFGEHPGDGDGRVGEGGGAGEPVGGEDVAADRERDLGRPAGADGAEDDQQQAEGGDDLAEPQATAVRWCVERLTAGRSNIRLATTAPTMPPATWATISAAASRGGRPPRARARPG